MIIATEERSGLFRTLAVAFLLVCAVVIQRDGALAVHPRTLGASVACWSAFGFLLMTHRETLGREGRYLDLWSIVHFGAGVLLAMFGLGLGWVLILTITWELVEISSRIPEYPHNRVVDIGLALVGAWLVGLST